MFDHAHRSVEGGGSCRDGVALHVDQVSGLGEPVAHDRVGDEDVAGGEHQAFAGQLDGRAKELARQRLDGSAVEVVLNDQTYFVGTEQARPKSPSRPQVDDHAGPGRGGGEPARHGEGGVEPPLPR